MLNNPKKTKLGTTNAKPQRPRRSQIPRVCPFFRKTPPRLLEKA